MTDPISISKTARESLSRGLNALQADPTVPPALVELAAPIAQAMGALHQIERTQALVPYADIALTHLRGALAQLQAHQSNHPAVINALDAVAGALSQVHSLSRMANGPQGGNTAQPPGPLPPPQAAGAPRTESIPQRAPQQAPQQAPRQAQAAPPQAAYPQGYAPTGPSPQQPGPAFAPTQQPYTAPQPQQNASQPQRFSNQPNQPSFPQQPQQPQMVSRDPFGAPAGPPASPSMPVPAPPPPGGAPLVNADLGAHSPTNFFKGLAGNDIIDHGGLFVSTYVLPKIGHPVRIKVSLPGGYEFEANAIVKWTREDGGGDVPPGFGAQFTQITPEARQLVYRYVRNREPMFYDDL